MLVVSHGTTSIAVAVTVFARGLPDGEPVGVRFSGPLQFDSNTQAHIRDVVAPAVYGVCGHLQLPQRGIRISVSTPGALVVSGTHGQVSGSSADMAVFLAMLSAHAGLSVPGDIVSTGQLTSSRGEIGLVQGLPAKLEAALADQSVSRFVLPDLERDASLAALSPRAKERIASALARARKRLLIETVMDVSDLVRVALGEHNIVLASLHAKFFDQAPPSEALEDGVAKAARHLTECLEQRFWAAL